jgi:hypothetical protein
MTTLRKVATVFAALTLLIGISLVVAAEDQPMKVGKTGEIVFTSETQVGDVTLKPGHYRFQHRVDGGDHYVKFTELKMSQDNHAYGTHITNKEAGEIKCNVEPMQAKAKQTAIYNDMSGGVERVTRIEIKGENVAHVF